MLRRLVWISASITRDSRRCHSSLPLQNFIGHDCVAQAACSQATAREQKINAGAGAAPEVLATSA